MNLGRQFTAGAKVPGVPTAGKSGTAELGGTGEPHSWFIGFAPANDPQIAIAVLVERGGRGGERAAPLGGALLKSCSTRWRHDDQGNGEPGLDRPNDEDAEHPTDVGPAAVERERRPALERIGLAAVAVVMAALFGGVAVAAFAGGEFFLAAMGFVGCMMTLVVGGITLLRG